jgi:hypothetical protein
MRDEDMRGANMVIAMTARDGNISVRRLVISDALLTMTRVSWEPLQNKKTNARDIGRSSVQVGRKTSC